jgi:membrane-associated protease RseP (regulator of RpoE activity)
VTALNLVPVGQLDGGHVAYALVGRRQRFVALFFIGALVALSLKWRGWLFWCVVMVTLVRVAHPPVVIEGVPLGLGRRILGWAAAVIFLLVFLPTPVKGVF